MINKCNKLIFGYVSDIVEKGAFYVNAFNESWFAVIQSAICQSAFTSDSLTLTQFISVMIKAMSSTGVMIL